MPDTGKSAAGTATSTATAHSAMASTQLPINERQVGLLRRGLLDVRVENREPVAAFLFPDASSIIGARHVFPIKCALDFHRVGRHDHVLLVGKDIVIADGKRL